MKDYVARLNLKTSIDEEKASRQELISFCLDDETNQYLAIGWSYIYEECSSINSFDEYYYKVIEDNRANNKRTNTCIYLFDETDEGDLFWTRDLNGYYWVCRAKGRAISYYNGTLDIGALVPVNAYCYGLEVPGQIKASFNRPRGGTAERIKDKSIIEFTKSVYNDLSHINTYSIERVESDILSNLPDLELEELVIAYIQIKEKYYLLSNSIANKSTTIAIECEFISIDRDNPNRAVVQVKGGSKILDAKNYEKYAADGIIVYLYASTVINLPMKNVIAITKTQLLEFYKEYKKNLPSSITKWEKLL